MNEIRKLFVFDVIDQQKLYDLPQSNFRQSGVINPVSTLIAYATDTKVEPDKEESDEFDNFFVVADLATGEELWHEMIIPAREGTIGNYEKMAFSRNGRCIAGTT